MGSTRAIAAAALVAGLAMAGCGGAAPAAHHHKPATFTLVGQVRVSDACASMSADGYSDITPGAQVTVTGPTGKTLAVGPLGTGMQVSAGGQSQCDFTFTVAGLPTQLAQYGITVSHRGTLDYTWAQVQHPVTMSLGANQ